jgi:hypothetical protein
MPLACAHDSRGRTIAKAPPSAGLRVQCAGITFEPECPDRFGAMLVLGGQMLPPRPVAPGYPEPTDTCETISAIFCKPRSPMGWPKRGRETPGCARLMSQGRGGQGCLVGKNKDFIRAISGRRAPVAKKKLEFGRNPGYPHTHIKKSDELGPRAWISCGLSSVSPVQSYGLPVLPTQDSTTPE